MKKYLKINVKWNKAGTVTRSAVLLVCGLPEKYGSTTWRALPADIRENLEQYGVEK